MWNAPTSYSNIQAGRLLAMTCLAPADATTLTRDEVARTHAVYSRISEKQLMWFVARATSAPWPPADADLRGAEPNIRNGLYDQLEAFCRHFKNDSPSQIARSKISKVLHVKRPAAYPILDSKVTDVYLRHAERAKASPLLHHTDFDASRQGNTAESNTAGYQYPSASYAPLVRHR